METYFEIVERPPIAGTVAIIKGQVKRKDGTKAVPINIPEVVVNRLEKLVVGNTGPAIVALIEYALNELESKGATILVENK